MNIIKLLMGAGKGNACTEEQVFDTSDNPINFASADSQLWIAVGFTPESNYSISKVSLCLYKANSPVFDVTARIYNNNTDRPGAQVGNDSLSVNASEFPAVSNCSVLQGFIFPTPIELTASTKYWIVLEASGFDISNSAVINLDSGETGGFCRGADGLTWAVVNAWRGFFTTYSGNCS